MGFEPTVHLDSAQRFSKPPPSAARPPLRHLVCKTVPAPGQGLGLPGARPHGARGLIFGPGVGISPPRNDALLA